MKKSRLTRILIEGNKEFLEQFTSEIEALYDLTIVSTPEKSLVMMKNRNAVTNQPFFTGEVLVTGCTVAINGKHGLGVVMGEKPEKAYQLSVVDAAFNAKLPETTKWLPLLEKEEERINKRHRRESALVARSKVNFDTMEDYNAKN